VRDVDGSSIRADNNGGVGTQSRASHTRVGGDDNHFGGKVHRTRAGSRVRVCSGGAVHVTGADGSQTHVGSSGAVDTVGADGSRTTVSSSGATRIVRADGSSLHVSSSGAVRMVEADG
jgi:hypothetical protein